jgi:selenocysteine-specific elongation factor
LGELEGTVFEDSPFMMVDSLSKKGIGELKKMIIEKLKQQAVRDSRGAFRLPVDQVFTVKGQGTVVRGTVYEGNVEEGQLLKVMPKGLEVRARQLQVHHQPAAAAYAGQRAAINLSGVSKEDIERGDVLVSSEHFIVTRTIDVAIRVVDDLEHLVKQRTPIKCHIGTAEVMGRIVFFDRNDIREDSGEILCQLRLEEDIVTKRGDRLIIRRPSPQETIGGGWVIDPRGNKYRFGEKTIVQLEKKKVGSPAERVTAALYEAKSLPIVELIKRTALDEGTLHATLEADDFVLFNSKEYTLSKLIDAIEDDITDRLEDYHQTHPMRQGVNKAELLQGMQKAFPKPLLDYVIENGIKKGIFNRREQFVKAASFSPHVPKNWEKRTENLITQLKNDGLKVRYLDDYIQSAGIPDSLSGELKRYLEDQGYITPLDDQYYWHRDHFEDAVTKLRNQTGAEFEVGDAKEAVDLSRKYMIPFLEKLDSLGFTRRVENKRIWRK